MYKEFATLQDLYQEIENDKNWTGAESSLRNRYPVRFVLFENFGDFGDFVQVCQDHGVYVQSIEKWMKDGQDDQLITYSQLATMFESYIKSLPANDFVIAPFSEITRFYDNTHYTEFDALLKTIRLVQSPEEAQQGHQRIYVPIIGMQSKVSKFKDDPNINIWEYHSGAENLNYRLVLTPGTTYGVQGLESRFSVCETLRQWVSLWKKAGTQVKPQILCSSRGIFANAGNAQPDNAFDYTICHNAFEFLGKGLGIDFGELTAEEEDLPFWEQLAASIDIEDFDFETFVNKRFNTSDLQDGISFVQTWFEYKDGFSRWLLKSYFLWKTASPTYLTRVLERCRTQSTSDLFSLLATQAFDEPQDEASLTLRRTLLTEAKRQKVQITQMAEQKVRAKLMAMAADPERGCYYAMKYMTSLTLAEQCLMTEWVGQEKVSLKDVQTLMPSLCDYMTPQSIQWENTATWIGDYFKEYTRSKMANKANDCLLQMLKEHNASQAVFESWREGFKTVKTILHQRQDIDLYYWIDGLGVDWIPFVKKVIEKHRVDGVYLNEVYVATAELPSVTAVNKVKLEELAGGKLEKIGDVDKFAHTQKHYPDYIVEELQLVEEAIERVLAQYNGKKIAFVSDHGISYMAQFGNGLNLAGMESDHSGRCAMWTQGVPPVDSNYVVLSDEKTICALNHNSLSSKTPMGQGAHGGATPEEVLVPVIIVSSQKNASAYAAKLQTTKLKASCPVVEYHIKGLSSIDTPKVSYNGVDYPLHRKQGDIYESERLNLVGTATRLTLTIGDFKQTDPIEINMGVQEDDLFDF